MTTLADLIWPRRTERLELSPMTADDGDEVWAYRKLPEVGYWTSGTPTDRADFDERYLSADHLAAHLVVRRDGEVVGDVMIKIGDGWGQRTVADRAASVQAEIGWTFAPQHQGEGFATEAVAEVLSICFDGLGLRRVVAEAFADNTPSWRLMERVGMRREARAKADSLHAELGWVDGITYALLAEEWRAR